jgi:ABC-type iron transport system FetAB permease component
MASSYSTDLKLELMVTGENAGTWGDKTNTNLNLIQQAIAGYQEVSIAGGAQTTALVMSDATISNARNAVIKFTGTITGNQIVTIPDSIEKMYTLINGTSGAFTVQFKTVSGTGFTFGTTEKNAVLVYSDGTNVVEVFQNTTQLQSSSYKWKFYSR